MDRGPIRKRGAWWELFLLGGTAPDTAPEVLRHPGKVPEVEHEVGEDTGCEEKAAPEMQVLPCGPGEAQEWFQGCRVQASPVAAFRELPEDDTGEEARDERDERGEID